MSERSTEPLFPQSVVSLDYSQKVNFSFQQNSIPVLRRLELHNNTETDWNHINCRIEVSPDWAEQHRLQISHIPAGSTYVLTDVPLSLNIDYLTNLSERVLGQIRIIIDLADIQNTKNKQNDETVVFEDCYPVDVFAYDEWTGLTSLPEILAAFVTPNLSVVEQLLSNAASILGKSTSSSGVDGYQAKSKKRVYEILSAIFDAIREQSIRYCNPPASFERTGQRVRFGTQLLSSRLGTCLDLCLLFASVIEQAGLNPIILMHKGHAYMGCWLIDESFSDAAMDDLQSIRKREELDELVVFEATLVCDGKGVGFTQAVTVAKQHLSLDAIFEHAIDVCRCRSSRIRPLPLQQNEVGVDIQKAHEDKQPLLPVSHSLEREFKEGIELDGIEKTPEGRVAHWKQQLLDLTLRNRLLNFRETKQTIPLLCPQIEHMEDELAADQTFKVLEQTDMIAGTDPRSLKLLQSQLDENTVVEHLMRELKAKRLRAPLSEKELSHRLLELYRRAKLENEESGANTLYLALGFLEWKQNRDDKRSFRAPILLVPVQLQRKSVQAGFSLHRHDEESLINVTLLELLKRDYELDVPGVNPPPEDDSGVDVGRVFQLFQYAIRDIPGWEVQRDVWLAQFSFNKFLLWKDLQDRSDILSKNAVVDHLINRAGSTFHDDVDDLTPQQLDNALGFEQIYCPLSADSSQLSATFAAANGKNFVMNGPPGTGKSQTITNIIAHCLAEGKRVLFVAEKRAALEVVHHRLTQVGLGPFCLELHSNKSGKAEVLRQFGEAIDYVDQHPSKEWQTIAAKLNQLRNELNEYVSALHKCYPNRLSAYQCYAWLIANQQSCEQYQHFDTLDINEPEKQSLVQLEALEEVCEQLILRGQTRRLSQSARDALHPIKATEWTPAWEDSVYTANEALLNSIKKFSETWKDVAQTLGLNVDSPHSEQATAISKLTELLRNAPSLPARFATEPNWSSKFHPIAIELINHGRARDEALGRLDGFNIDALFSLDTEALESAHKTVINKGGILSKFNQWRRLKPVRKARKKGAPKWTSANAQEFFKAICQLKASTNKLDSAATDAEAHFGTHWNKGEANWNEIETLIQFGEALHSTMNQIAGDSIEVLINLRSKVGDLISAGSEFLQEGGSIEKLFSIYIGQCAELEDLQLKHCELLSLEEKHGSNLPTEEWEAFCCILKENRKYLSNWCRWQDAFQKANNAGLSKLLNAVRSELLELEDIRKAFDYSYRNTFLKRLLTLSPVLREFFGDEHKKRIDAFKDLDARYTELTGSIVAARLASRLPRARSEDCPESTELGMLKREMVKKRRHKPVRKLLAETPGIAPHLKPCFLMSPLSVAQYLDAEQTDFDIVVFDEASQIPVWDAVGAIARGKQLIVVGDPKQLPPTNFFGRVDDGEGFSDDTQTEDLESILDECLGSGLKVHNLLWHYRSKKEGLIAFSNYHYYNNELHTFPSPHSENVGVSLVPVPEGFYDKGKSRTNKAEADAISKEVLRRLLDPDLAIHSIGIVTFSQAQQGLILDMLDEIRRQYPEIEGHFGEDSDEPVFVKNLENVQGDERDVILFSICYGPDQGGKLSMNFGPLNRDGGERRLNVAVTRAKHEVVIFSTLRSEQIDLSRTRALGTAHLKSYLEYAERGPSAIAANIESAHTEDYDSVFEKEVAEYLRGKGYTVHTQVGCSGYRIDLAVVHPERPGHYLIGIECDGATYHRAATARDRDRLRQSVLEGLGWRFHRIWSTDWWRNSEQAKEDLLLEVDAALRMPVQEHPRNSIKPANKHLIDIKDPDTTNTAELSIPTRSSRKQDYPQPKVNRYGPPEDFYEANKRSAISSQIIRIVEQEGPITIGLLMRRVAEEWGFSRVASRIRKIVTASIPNSIHKTEKSGITALWPQTLEPSAFSIYRITSKEIRKFEDIPIEELCNAGFDILEKYKVFPKDGFAAEIARQFDVKATGLTTSISEEAVKCMLQDKAISADGDNYRKTE